MRSWTPAVPIAAALGFSAAVFDMLPLEVRPALGALMPMALPDDGDALPRSVAAVLLPAIAALMWALFAWGARIKGPQRPFPAWLASEATTADAVARFASTYATLVFTLVTLVALMHLVMLGSVIGWPAWTFQLFTAAVGLAMLTAGNVIPRARPNWIVGIRTRGTLASAEVWMRTHRLLGAFLMAAGALVIVASAVAPSYAVLLAVAGTLLALVAAHQLGARGRRDGAASVVALGLVSAIHAFGIVGVAGAQTPSVKVDTVAPRGIPLVGGREFQPGDGRSAPRITVVSAALARSMFGNESPIGARVGLPFGGDAEIVGVVGDVRTSGLDGDPGRLIYLAAEQVTYNFMTVLVKTRGNPRTVTPAVRALVRELDRELPMHHVRTGDDLVSGSVSRQAFQMAVVSAFSLLVFVLAVVGTYGVVSYTASERTRELGIRLALGATTQHIRRLVLRDGARLAVLGILVGMVASVALSRALSRFVFQIGVLDPVTFIGAPLLLASAVLVATLIPAHRATRVDPIQVLRVE